MTDLVLATNDRDLLAVIADVVEFPVFRVSHLEPAALFARSANLALAIGPDMLGEAMSLNFPFAVLYANRAFLDVEALNRLRPPLGIYELPGELDWLSEKLGHFTPVQKNGARS